MNRLYMKARTQFLRTSIGKKVRYWKQVKAYKAEDAKRIVDNHFAGMTEQEKGQIVNDMMVEAKKYNVGFDEYIMYHFDERSFDERREFICTRERATYCERLNRPENQMIFDDKGKTYEVFKKYFRRDLIEIVGWRESEKKQLNDFVGKHSQFIIKPFNGGNGQGIQIIDTVKYESFEALYQYLQEEYKDGFVAEELIIQAKELAEIHPESVNTMRIFTVRFDDRVEFLPFAWRVGRGSSCVDNGGSGGIFCALDENGTIIKTSDEKGKFYDVHPDTKHPLIGFAIPRFDEAKQLAKELAMVVPSNRYCGWDLALTDDGWIMQEGNWQGGIVAFQCPLQKGYRKELDAIMQELHL